MRYPDAEWVPWRYTDSNGHPAYYKGMNEPAAAVLHTMAGYAATARAWAKAGYSRASWHFTIAQTGHVMQHLEFSDGGYHAGIMPYAPAPKWLLWRGPSVNINHYTIGIEHEGAPPGYEPAAIAGPLTPPQAAASKKLCRWLADTLGWTFDYHHFPPHAAIDLVNRPNDFNIPSLRTAHYAYLFDGAPQEDDLANWQQLMAIPEFRDFVLRISCGSERLDPVAGITEAQQDGHINEFLRDPEMRQSLSDVAHSALVIAVDASEQTGTNNDDALQAKVADALAKAAATIATD